MLENRVASPGVAQWCQRLEADPLPVMPVSAHALHKALKLPDVALHDLGDVIASDPIMTLHLIRECQRQFGKRVEGSLSNIHHCVAMLGLDKTLILARTFRPLTEPLDQHIHYLDALGCALHGAEQARQWLLQRHPVGADQTYMAALLLGIVDAALWHCAPREMRAIQVLTEQEAIPDAEADLAVLGCTRVQLAHALAQRWHFPAAVMEAIEPESLPDLHFLVRHSQRALKHPQHKLPNRDNNGHLVRSQGLYVRIARWLALWSRHNWYSKSLHRCHTILAACLFIPLQDARQLTTETSLKLSRHWPVPLIAAPACSLIWPPAARPRRRIKPAQLGKVVTQLLAGKNLPASATSTSRPPTKPRAKPRVVPPPAAPWLPPAPPKIGLSSQNLPADLDRNAILNAPLPTAPAAELPRYPGFKSLEKKQQFDSFIHRLLTQPDDYDTEHEVIRAVVETLHDCTELARVVVALHNPKPDQIEGFFALGCDDFPGLKNYRVKLQPANLFTHLMKQPAGLWLSPDRPNKAAGLIPGSFKQASQTDNCFLMAVFNHKGPYGMLYADRGINNRLGLSEHEYRIFKTACSACSKHLISRGKWLAAKKPER